MYKPLWILLFQNVAAVIYNLNDSEYNKMPSLFALDEYSRCLSEQEGIYCLAQLHLYSDESNDLITLMHEYSEFNQKHYNYTCIDRGVCVKRTCKEFIRNRDLNKVADLNATLEECLNEKIYSEYGVQAKLATVYNCDKHENGIELDVADGVVAGIVIAIIATNVISSLFDVLFFKETDEINERQAKILSFSIARNWRKLVSNNPDPKLECLKVFYGLRAITTFFMISAHVMFMQTSFTENPHDFEKAHDKLHYQIIFNGLMIVQIYFVMSGFLMTYNLLIDAEKHVVSWILFPLVMFRRWWRLTPSSALMIAISATWLRHLGSGPLWTLQVANSVVADCRSHWWQHLFYINNLIPDGKFCALHTWHIAADTQLFMVGLFVYLLTRSQGRKVALGVLLLLGMAAPAFHVWWSDLDGLVVITPEFCRTLTNDNYYHLHVYGHTNICAFVIGMIAAQMVYNWQKKQVDFSKYKIYPYFLWGSVPAVLLLFRTGSMFALEGPRASLAFRMAYAATHRAVLGLIVAVVTVGVVMKSEANFRSFWEWSGWVVPSRLSYSVYVLHMLVINVLVGMRPGLVRVSFFYTAVIHLGVVFLSYLLAVPYHLAVEAPFNELMKRIINRERLQEKKKIH